MDKGLSQCGHFADGGGEGVNFCADVNFARFCADVFYGRPLIENKLPVFLLQ